MDHSAADSERGIDRRRLIGWGGLAAAGVAAYADDVVTLQDGRIA
jgi:hypothetical protein